MSLFSLMKDEHVGSFWFRNHAIKGSPLNHKNLRRVMTNSAKSWRLFPWMGSEYKSSDIFNNHTLLNMFRPTGIPNRAPWVGNGDQKGMGGFSNHFGDYRSILVRYCPICFIEQISDNGFVWFKRQWLIFNAAHCLVHKCSLQTFQCGNCGKTPHIHAGIESFLIGCCIKCKQAFPKKHKRVRKIPPLTLWLNYVLERNFPHFSGNLVNHLMYHSYWVLQKEQPKRAGWVANHVYHLYKKYMREQVASSLIWVPDEYNAMFYLEYIIRQFRWQGSRVPLIMFWVAMMETFQNFEEFESFLESECALKTGEYGGKPDAEFLDLKNPRSLYSIHRSNGYV